jgi:hypothetical protein
METLRVPPYPLTTTWTLPIANYEYIQYVEDLVDHSVIEESVTSDANGVVLYTLPLEKVQFDRKFLIRFYDTEHQHILYEDNLDVIRPYVDPNSYSDISSEIKEYQMFELIARSVIDNYITDGFYNTKSIIQKVGSGTDYFALWKDVNKVLKVYENNELVYDSEDIENSIYNFVITLDNSAIMRVINERSNRHESIPITLPAASGDLTPWGGGQVSFPVGFDYIFICDAGYKTVPADVEVATKMLIEDIKCGKLDYFKRYVTRYDTDQFKIEFDKVAFEGSGNILVDKILDKYRNNILRPGLL